MPSMEEENQPLENAQDTQPIAPPAQPEIAADAESAPTGFSLWRPMRLFVVIAFVAVIIAAIGGYFAGIHKRQAAEQETVEQVTQEQFALGESDLENGRYEIAKQRFEYIINLNPMYPGAAEKLAEALLALNAPTATLAPIYTPTPNLAPVQDLFEQAEEAFAAEDWSAVIETLLALRAKDSSYRAVEADGMMFTALRNRGVYNISTEGILEEGIYDLSRAARFGPLDRDAHNWREWAELYLIANSYYGINWAQATYYFGQLYLVAPYLKNNTYYKYAFSSQSYGDQLYDANDYCAASEQYYQSLLAWENPDLITTATKAAKACMTATAHPPAPPQPTETPTPTPTKEGEEPGG